MALLPAVEDQWKKEQWKDEDLVDLLKEGFIVVRPYAQAFCLIMDTTDWRKQSNSSGAPYYAPLQNFENAMRKAGLVPTPVFDASMAMSE
jgi:hypothetical protein